MSLGLHATVPDSLARFRSAPCRDLGAAFVLAGRDEAEWCLSGPRAPRMCPPASPFAALSDHLRRQCESFMIVRLSDPMSHSASVFCRGSGRLRRRGESVRCPGASRKVYGPYMCLRHRLELVNGSHMRPGSPLNLQRRKVLSCVAGTHMSAPRQDVVHEARLACRLTMERVATSVSFGPLLHGPAAPLRSDVLYGEEREGRSVSPARNT